MKNLLVSFILLSFVFVLNAQVVQWRGPNRDGQFPATNLLKSWPENGPELILKVEKTGKGWTSPILVGDMIYTKEMIDTLDSLMAFDMQENLIWQIPDCR